MRTRTGFDLLQYAIIVNTAIFILGVIVQCTATAGGHNSILGGRFVTGMGVGSLSMVGHESLIPNVDC